MKAAGGREPRVPGAGGGGGFWPSIRDPRLPFALLLTLYAALGLGFLGFNRSLPQFLTLIGAACALDVGLARLLRGRWILPLSAYITGASLGLLLNYAHESSLLLLPVALAIGSKYLFTFEGRHVFNPSLFGIAVTLLVAADRIAPAPAYQWAGGGITASAFLVLAALSLFVFRVGRGPLIVSFLVLYALQTALRAWLLRWHLPPEVLFLGTLTSPAFLLFTFYMLPDPATSPPGRRGQIALAFAVVAVDLYLHTRESVYTFFYAAFAVGAARLVALHARELWRRGARARLGLAPAWLARAGGVAALGAGLVLIPAELAGTRAGAADPGFRFVAVPPGASGLDTRPSDVLERVDPRLAHIAKWLLSVGDAAAVGDVDGDGRLDLFLTNTLQRRDQRAALYRNLGGLRFERIPVPALARIAADPLRYGLPAGGCLLDVDGDGDRDLAVAMGFGPSRLFRNRWVESGRLEFEDVTESAGWNEHGVSLAVTFLDVDRDARLEALVTQVLAPRLAGYDAPPPLHVFRLPAPAYPGDRRMLRFLHDGWHDADNGGPNRLLRGLGGLRFALWEDAGLEGTRWTTAVAAGDLDRDGWTDLYAANDFGPDDLWWNRRGRGFERQRGGGFGAVGRDTYKGMNATLADFDRDGWLDVYVSNVHHPLQAEGSLLWMARPRGPNRRPAFRDEAMRRGVLNERRWGWGAAAGDLDHDGWLDLVQANGMVDDRLDPRGYERKDYWYVNHKLMQSGPEIHTYADAWGDLRGRVLFPNEPRRVYRNRGAEAPGRFVDVARFTGAADPENSRGVVLADLDDDGDLDLLITNQHGPPSLYRNTLRAPGAPGPPGASFVGLQLVGDGARTHREALGTRVTVRHESAGRVVEQVREATVLSGFSAQGDPRLHFGLGDHDGPVTAIVAWYGAEAETLSLAANRWHEVRQ